MKNRHLQDTGTPLQDTTARREKRILVVDDHPQVRRGMVLVLQSAGAGTCLEAGDRREALSAVRLDAPDAAVVDLSLGDDDGMQLVRELSGRRIPVIVCSLHEDPVRVRQALEAGARGYVTKQETTSLVRAVKAVLEDWIVISPRAADGLYDD